MVYSSKSEIACSHSEWASNCLAALWCFSTRLGLPKIMIIRFRVAAIHWCCFFIRARNITYFRDLGSSPIFEPLLWVEAHLAGGDRPSMRPTTELPGDHSIGRAAGCASSLPIRVAAGIKQV